MLCKDNMVSLDNKSKKSNAKHIFSSFFSFLYIYIYKPYHKMHECYAMQILKAKKTKQQRRMVTKSREMKHKDHDRKT